MWGHELNFTATIRDPPTPQPELFTLYEEPGGARPDRLSEVRPQDRDLRRTVDQFVGAVPGFPALDVPLPQMVDQPVVLLAAFDVLVPEQVIEVPKMSTPTRCPRTVLSVPQTAEQLVEFPNVVSLIDVIRHPVEWKNWRSSWFLPGQSSSAFYGADHRAAAATAEQNVDIPVPRGAPHDVHQIPLPAAGSSDLLETANQGVVSTFPRRKKCEDPAHPGVGTGRGLQLMASVSLAGGLPVDSGTGGSRASWGTTWVEAAFGSLGEAGTMPSSCVSLRLLWKNFIVSSCPSCSRNSHLESGALFPLSLYLAVLVPGVWVLLMSTNIGFFGRRLSSWEQCLVLQWIHALRQFFGYGRISHMFLRCGRLGS